MPRRPCPMFCPRTDGYRLWEELVFGEAVAERNQRARLPRFCRDCGIKFEEER